MIRWVLFISLLTSVYSYAGVSVVGTRFFFNDKTKKINIKIINDHESDYLIKTNINEGGFIVSPPLLLIRKDRDNIVSIIPDGFKFNSDKVFDLVVTAIPKSNLSDGNKINLSIRSHFKLIYRYKPINENILDSLSLGKDNINQDIIYNPTNSFISLYISCDSNINEMSGGVNIYPHQKILVNHCDEMWASLINDDGSISPAKRIYTNKLENI